MRRDMKKKPPSQRPSDILEEIRNKKKLQYITFNKRWFHVHGEFLSHLQHLN